jgi:hypothetical protein
VPNLNQAVTNLPSTSSYTSLLKARIIGFPKTSITITNSHGSYGIKYKILVSNHPQGIADTWAEEKAEATLAAAAAASYTITGPFVWVDVQIIDASGGSHGIGNCWLQATGI